MPPDVPLTVYGGPNYKCSATDLKFPNNTKLVITPPPEGCTICFSQKVEGKTQHDIPGGDTTKIEFKGFNVKDEIHFCTYAYQKPCTPVGSKKDDNGHTITIDTGTK